MVLSNNDIQAALDAGALVIRPAPSPRRPAEGVKCPFQTSAVDLTLGNELAWLKPDMPIAIDLRRGAFNSLFAGNCVRKTLENEEVFVLKPGQLVLGRTHEFVGLPIRETGPWLAARVEGRSSYARCGLLVHFTAPTIHAGFGGTITLEIMNFGPYSLSLSPGTPICQLIVEQVSGKPFRRDSQFHGQAEPTGGTR
jgi:dCTP deaminase